MQGRGVCKPLSTHCIAFSKVKESTGCLDELSIDKGCTNLYKILLKQRRGVFFSWKLLVVSWWFFPLNSKLLVYFYIDKLYFLHYTSYKNLKPLLPDLKSNSCGHQWRNTHPTYIADGSSTEIKVLRKTAHADIFRIVEIADFIVINSSSAWG